MHNHLKHVTIGFYSKEDGGSIEHYNFWERKNHDNIVTTNAVFKRWCILVTISQLMFTNSPESLLIG
jgi:hypothetical protein